MNTGLYGKVVFSFIKQANEQTQLPNSSKTAVTFGILISNAELLLFNILVSTRYIRALDFGHSYRFVDLIIYNLCFPKHIGCRASAIHISSLSTCKTIVLKYLFSRFTIWAFLGTNFVDCYSLNECVILSYFFVCPSISLVDYWTFESNNEVLCKSHAPP